MGQELGALVVQPGTQSWAHLWGRPSCSPLEQQRLLGMGAPGHSGRVRALSLVGDAIVSDGGGNSTQRAPGPFTCSRIQGCQRDGRGLRTLHPWGRQIPGGHLTQVQALPGEAQAQGWRVRASPQPLRMPPPQAEAPSPGGGQRARILGQAEVLREIMLHYCPAEVLSSSDLGLEKQVCQGSGQGTRVQKGGLSSRRAKAKLWPHIRPVQLCGVTRHGPREVCG